MRRLAAALVVLAFGAAPAAAAAAEPEVVKQEQLQPRLVEYTLRTSALQEETRVRVLLPDGYDPAAKRRYPVIYLLHGCCDDWRSWADKGDVVALTAGLPLIVVMPDGGMGGWYSDWVGAGADGSRPQWEDWHIDQMIPWVERTFRVLPRREGRAIAGLSMGGFGAMSYAGRHPDLFVAAAAFSGAVDILDPTIGPVDDGTAFLDAGPPGSIWGPRGTEEERWRAHNPVDLAENLRGMSLTLRTGNGEPGGAHDSRPDPVEVAVHQQTLTMHARLDTLGMAHVFEDYGAGAHDWPYWQDDLRKTLPSITSAFAEPPPAPARFTYKSGEPRYSVYGWDVALERPALEFSRLAEASKAGFTLEGSGTAAVSTPPRYKRDRDYDVRVGDRAERVRSDGDGRLRLRVPLGPGNPYQAYTAEAMAAGTRVFRTSVAIAALPCTSRRSIVIHPRVAARPLAVYVNGRRTSVFRAPGAVRVRLTGRPRQTVRVRLVARGVTETRTYRTCRPRPRRG